MPDIVGGTMNSDSQDTDSGNRNERAAGAGQLFGEGSAARRAQAAREGVVAAGREASEWATEAAQRAKAAALPALSRAKEDGARQWSAIDQDVKKQVAISLLSSATIAAGEHLKTHKRLSVRLIAVGIVAAAPIIATHAARAAGKAAADTGQTAETAEAADSPGGGGSTGPRGQLAAAPTVDPAMLSQFIDALGTRQPIDPEDLYREGSDPLELTYPLPEALAALPWDSLSRRNRFFVLVAAWAAHEADGIQLLRSGQLEEAKEVFLECLARARRLEVPELAVRSCEDLGQLSVIARDEDGARQWHAEGRRIIGR
jgi:hypothetical protein